MARVLLNHVWKRYPGAKDTAPAVQDLCVDIADQEFVALIGPSGCGKSSTLRMIAGLESITKGDVYIDDVLVNDLSPKQRNISMVFQNYALYPNLTNYENLAFGLRVNRVPKYKIDEQVNKIARSLDISNLLERYPREVSGGQRQRVALGRAIIRDPKVFLMDEPLSNLDAKMRVQMRIEIIRIHRALQATTIYVTHDQIEAMTMADRIVVMDKGVVQQIGTPDEVYNEPANMFVGGFVGTPPMNFIQGDIREYDGEYYFSNSVMLIKIPPEKLKVIREKNVHSCYAGIRPEHMQISSEYVTGHGNVFRGHVEFTELIGADCHVHVNIGKEGSIVIRTLSSQRYQEGQEVSVIVDLDRFLYFDRNTTQRVV